MPNTPAEVQQTAQAIYQRFRSQFTDAHTVQELVRAITRTISTLGCKSADELLARGIFLRQQFKLQLSDVELREVLLLVLFDRWPDDEADAARLIAQLVRESGGPVGTAADRVPSGSGPFGRCLDNPIPVAGIVAERFYLNRLRTADGMSVEWRRIGSQTGAGKPVDCYQLTDFLGESIGQVFLSPYHQHTSELAPDGLVLLPYEITGY